MERDGTAIPHQILTSKLSSRPHFMHFSLILQKLVTYFKNTLKILSESLMPILTRSLDPANLEVPDSGSA